MDDAHMAAKTLMGEGEPAQDSEPAEPAESGSPMNAMM
jgi:hypothetical protein